MADPEILKKNGSRIESEVAGRIPAYTSEWSSAGDETGSALIKVYADLMDITIRRLNLAPRRQFLAFLESLNFTLFPAQSARAALTFLLSEGTPEPELIPALSQVSAPGPDGKPIMFETEENLLASPAKITSLYSVEGLGHKFDRIYDHATAIGGKGVVSLFCGTDLQEHALYIGASRLFSGKNNNVLTLTFRGASLSALHTLSWQYSAGVVKREDGTESVVWADLKLRTSAQCGPDQYSLTLEKKETVEINEQKIYGIKSRWIRGRLNLQKGDISTIKNIIVKVITVSVSSPAAIPVSQVQGIGPIFSKRLQDLGITTIHQLIQHTDTDLAKTLTWDEIDNKNRKVSHKCSLLRAVNILEAARKAFYDKTGLITPGTGTVSGVLPDFLFFNDVPLPVTEFYPFGKKPQLFSTWYIASEEVFSKEGYAVTLSIILEGLSTQITTDIDQDLPILSWEYWDGASWKRFVDPEILLNRNPSSKTITIPVLSFPRVEKTTINGIKNYWIRVRLVGGRYGPEFETKIIGPTNDPKCTILFGPFYAPKISGISLLYSSPPLPSGNADPASFLIPDSVFSTNNLCVDYKTSPEKSFRPFVALADEHPALYVSFDQSLLRGETSLFLAFNETIEYPDTYRPKLSWQYLGPDSQWKETLFIDETHGFTRSGMVKIFIPGPMSGARLFGAQADRFWIRAVNTENQFCSLIPEDAPSHVPPTGTFNEPKIPGSECRGTFEVMNASLTRQNSYTIPPQITGIYNNAVWATQSTTISDETLGSGSGEQTQSFSLLHSPVTNETVQVNELSSLSESEKQVLEEQKIVEKITDNQGTVLEFWVTWKAVEDLVNSALSDRNYIIDRTSGIITFGDGKNGRIPPIGRNNIRVRYSTGGGSTGNLPVSTISKIHSAVVSVDKVTNVRPSLGGTDTESTDDLVTRAPSALKNRGRAVTAVDYEVLALLSSPDVARAKALQNARLPKKAETAPSSGYFIETGYVTVVIIPWSAEPKPVPSPALMNTVRNYLGERCPNVVTLDVIRPAYVSAGVTAEIIPERMDAVPVIEREAKKKVTAFLHPLTGNTDGKGWPLGTVPCISNLYSVIEEIADVAYVKSLVIKLTGDNDLQVLEISDTTGVISLPGYAQIYPGECSVTALPPNGSGSS